jgi:hypothetical protein
MFLPPALAILSIGLANELGLWWLVIAWPLGTVAVLVAMVKRARQLNQPLTMALLLPAPRLSRPHHNRAP